MYQSANPGAVAGKTTKLVLRVGGRAGGGTRPWSSAVSVAGQERPCLLGQTNQFRYGMESELPHQPAPVKLHGLQADAQASGDLLVEHAGGDEKEYLALPGLQGAQELPDPAGLLLPGEFLVALA
jgi:hypothetical protein